MNSEIAKERISYVVRPDSITSSEGDFLATHVSLKKLKLLDKFELAPTGGKSYTEEQLFEDYIKNPEDKHQFIAVYGQSGTGKSHLIRWFAARYMQSKPKDEVVLFIRRSDNTLKGTIRQLLEKPEVQEISNKEIYERLAKAAVSVEEKKLKDLIYHNFIIEADNDLEEHEIKLGGVTRKKLIAFLNNEVVHDYFMDDKGPIERMYSKIAEHSVVDRDTVAQFEVSDFLISQDLYEAIQTAGGDIKAEKLARELISDEKGPKTAKELTDYLNQFRNDVIQRCAGIEPGDFKQIFSDIRKELYRLDMQLTLFIEDVTSFTGVDTALLDALIEEHTGKREGERLCRISSIVGTTNYYLDHNFQSNHKDRITKYIYIPSDVLDEKGIYEFVAKYLNTMSLPEERINEWVENHANPEDYPIHDVLEGKSWEYVSIGHAKRIPLYPFNKKCIMYFYNKVLIKGHQTPRYIIKEIIEPVVRDAIFNKNEFPSLDIPMSSDITLLAKKVQPQVNDENTAKRLLTYMSVWGNGEPEQYEKDGKTFIAELSKEYYDEFGLPIIDVDRVEHPGDREKDGDNKETEGTSDNDKGKDLETEYPEISADKIQKVDSANALLIKWLNEKKIDISARVGAAGTVHAAVYDEMKDYLFSAINWQTEGITMDNARKIKDSTLMLVSLEGQTKNEGLLVLPASWDSISIILAFVRWKVFGSGSWFYKDGDYDAFVVTSWTEGIKKELVKKVSEYKPGIKTNYIEAAVAAEMYRTILAGEFREKSLKNFNTQVLLASKVNKSNANSHSKEWNSLLSRLAVKNRDKNNQQTVVDYFCIEQAGAKGVKVIDASLFQKVFGSVKRNHLEIDEAERQSDDKITQRRDAYAFLSDIEEGLESVSKAELEKGKECIKKICEALGDDEIDEDEIAEFVSRIKAFYSEANKAQVNVKEISLDGLKNIPTIAKAISDINSVMDENDPLAIIMAFSGDPINTIQPLIAVIDAINGEVEKAKNQIANKLSQLGNDDGDTKTEGRYEEELKCIKICRDKVEGMVNV